MIKNYGYLPPLIKPEEFVAGAVGSLPSEILRPDGNWSLSATDNEKQAGLEFDPANCTAEGLVNQIQAYLKEKFGIDEQFDKRALTIVAGIRPPGANPHDVYEVVRRFGLCPEGTLPPVSSVHSLEEFLNPAPYTIEKLKEMGIGHFLSRFNFFHEWGFYPTASVDYKKKMLSIFFKSCPPAYSVVAWKEKDGRYYKEVGELDNHWTLGQSDLQDAWGTKDSYDPFDKLLEKNYDFGTAKRIYIEKKKVSQSAPSLWQIIMAFFANLLRRK